ncbi:hypothetical protein [Pelomonas sp. SE-A7]|uniref:type IV pilus modification PilV family protein n=1 Tax=Pelomonas sp. SE-A7 TaxID=3054953 RepID=UPI00259D26A3|nr:hypothetical protein [Pelomonas sp. SE-A7]MDM4765105.1 hypothetical protein [Pelomonas sp. SE-A7]
MNTPQPRISYRRSALGVTLIEAMVALLIMSFGMLALVGLQGNLRRSGDVAKQRGEATKLAQSHMESVRAIGALLAASAPPSTVAFSSLSTASSASIGAASSNTSYALMRSVTRVDTPPMAIVDVALNWTDRASESQQVRLSTFVAGVDPALSGSLQLPPPGGVSSRRPQSRSVDIPSTAKDLGEGHSVFKPDPFGTVAWVFSNLSGEITGVCTGIAMATQTRDLTVADVSACGSAKAYLLSGYVRYSMDSPPNPDLPNSSFMSFGLTLTVDAPADYPLTPSYQCFARQADAVTGGYYCAVYPKATGLWSGRLDLSGFSLGAYKVCRYSADYDGNGSISNAEHPASYADVKGALTQQNFLLIRATNSCPAGHGVDTSVGHFTNTRTEQHQP